MSYDSDHTRYVTAVSMAGAAAVVLPYARPISFMMGLMIADPADMQRAAAQWNDKSPVDIGPPPALFSAGSNEFHPPMAAPNGGDINYLRQELGRLARDVGANKEWVGASYDMFMKAFKEFDEQLLLLEDRRKSVGDSLDSAAEILPLGRRDMQLHIRDSYGIGGFCYGRSLYPAGRRVRRDYRDEHRGQDRTVSAGGPENTYEIHLESHRDRRRRGRPL